MSNALLLVEKRNQFYRLYLEWRDKVPENWTCPTQDYLNGPASLVMAWSTESSSIPCSVQIAQHGYSGTGSLRRNPESASWMGSTVTSRQPSNGEELVEISMILISWSILWLTTHINCRPSRSTLNISEKKHRDPAADIMAFLIQRFQQTFFRCFFLHCVWLFGIFLTVTKGSNQSEDPPNSHSLYS